jgi:hypothetical protein
MRELLENMANKNIGSLCLFLNNPKNEEYLKELNNNIPIEALDLPTSEKIYYYVNNIEKIILCNCGKKKSFIGFKNGYRKTCGDKNCFVKKRKETNLEKWGVDNPKKSKEILKREKENIKKKWGVDHYMLSDKVKNKFKKTMMHRWGVEWAQQSEQIKEKSLESWNNNDKKEEIITKRVEKLVNKTDIEKEEINKKRIKTIIENWGSYHNFINYRLDSIKNKSLEKWGVDHHLKNKDIKIKRVESYKKNILNKINEDLPNYIIFNYKKNNKNETDSVLNFTCLKCNNEFNINRQLFVLRKKENQNICLKCNPILSGKSKKELEVLDFIKSNYNSKINTNVKNIIDGEIDIYLPDLKLGFEFNGYWHSDQYKDKLYHCNKTESCFKLGIELIHIWEDEWDFRKDLIKSLILKKIGLIKGIELSNYIIKEINNNICYSFLDENHIKKSCNGSIKLSLFDENNCLISVMIFKKIRGKESYELVRHCDKLGTITNSFHILLNYFKNNFKTKDILIISDNSYGLAELEKYNFELIEESKYSIKEINGLKIFDSGYKKWIYKNELFSKI